MKTKNTYKIENGFLVLTDKTRKTKDGYRAKMGVESISNSGAKVLFNINSDIIRQHRSDCKSDFEMLEIDILIKNGAYQYWKTIKTESVQKTLEAVY